MYQSGQFDSVVFFDRVVTGTTAAASPTAEWEEIDWDWAEVKSNGGNEITEADSPVPLHTYRVRVRHREDILERDRIRHGDKMLYINSVSHDSGRSPLTEYLCTEYRR